MAKGQSSDRGPVPNDASFCRQVSGGTILVLNPIDNVDLLNPKVCDELAGCYSGCRRACRRSLSHSPSRGPRERRSPSRFWHRKSARNSVQSRGDIGGGACCPALGARHPPVENPAYSSEPRWQSAARGSPTLRPCARRRRASRRACSMSRAAARAPAIIPLSDPSPPCGSQSRSGWRFVGRSGIPSSSARSVSLSSWAKQLFQRGKLHVIEIGNLRRHFVLLRDDAIDQLIEPLFGTRKAFDGLFLMRLRSRQVSVAKTQLGRHLVDEHIVAHGVFDLVEPTRACRPACRPTGRRRFPACR